MSHGDDTIQIINLADNINAAFDKINENFELLDAGLSQEEVIALIVQYLGDHLAQNPHLDEAAIRAFLKDADLDIGTGKLTYRNNYDTFDKLPDASTYHGMFAHVHNPPAAYYAHGGQWIELANKSDVGTGSSDVESLDDLDDVQFSSPVLVGHVLKWDGTKWTNLEDSSGGDGGGGNGDPGTSFYQATIFKRATSQPATPTGGTFDFTTATLTPPSEPEVWEGTIPDGEDDLWACNFLFRDYLSQQGTVIATDWSEPYRLAGLIDVNSNGESYAQVSIYRRWSPPDNDPSASLGAPSGGSFDFDPSANQPLTPPSEWYLTPPSEEVQSGDLYVSAGIATTSGLAEGETLDTNISWTLPVKTSTGTDGQPGKSIFEKAVYRKVVKPDGWSVGDNLPVPPKPEGGYFNFGEEIFGSTPPNVGGPLDDVSGETGVWFAGVPEGPGDVWSSVYPFSVVGDTGTDYAVEDGWSEPTLGFVESVSTYKKSLYARSATRPTTNFTNNNVIYSFTHDKFLTIGDSDVVDGIDGSTLWYEEPPELDLDNPMDLWEVTTTASLIGYLGEDRDLTFGDIKLSLNYAVDAENGYSFLQLNLYKWSTAESLPKPASDYATFNFTTKKLILPTGDGEWKQTIPDNPDPDNENSKLFVTTGTASTRPDDDAETNEPKTEDNDIQWSDPDVTTAGGAGRDGRSSYLVRIVKKHVVTEGDPTPDTPTGGVVNFGQNPIDPASQNPPIDTSTLNTDYLVNGNIPGNSVVPPAGWEDAVSDLDPNESGTIFESERTFAINGDTGYEIAGSDWSAPYEDHNNGEDGYSTFSASVYKRSANKPAADGDGKWGPVGATYSFTNDAVENLEGTGWSENPQESNDNLDPLWLCRATATTKGLTGTDASLTWSEPVQVSSDGQPGSGIVVDLSNENHSITAKNDGSLYNTSLLGAITTLQVFNGDDDITPSTTVVPTLPEGIEQGGGDNQVNWTQTEQTTIITHVGDNVDEFTLTFTVLGRSTVFTLTKIKAAADGTPPTVYRLLISASVIKADPSNKIHTPDRVDATAVKYTGGQAPQLATEGEVTIKRRRNGSESYSDESTSGTLSYLISDGTTETEFELWVSGVMVDAETVPVVFDGTDSGDITVPPRLETGYVYYTVADGSEDGPQKPSATSFTFIGSGGNSGTDGVFDGLTDNWSVNPPGSTNLEGTYWAARFTAFEDTAGGGVATDANDNLHFSTPFKNYSFNGLVTFENLNAELADLDPNSSRITTIDGGKLTTGTVVADSIRATEVAAVAAQIQQELTIGGAATDIDTTQSGDYTASGERMVLTGENIRIYDATSTDEATGLRVKLGKLSE